MKNHIRRKSQIDLTDQIVLSNFTETATYVDSHVKLIASLCNDVNSQFAKKVKSLLKDHDYENLLELSITPHSYKDENSYRDDAMIMGLIKKYPHWNTKLDPKLAAMKTFIACEARCRETNARFRSGSPYGGPVTEAIFASAAKNIERILGDCPTIDELSCKFGPGSNVNIKNNTTVYNKLNAALSVTTNCEELAVKYLQACPGWLGIHSLNPTATEKIRKCLTLVPGDNLSFVPKSAKTDRPIGVAPVVNSVVQKAIGSCIRQKLKPVIDLSITQEKHKILARKGSIDQMLATVDLASASDTISYGLVLDLLPLGWFNLLDQARSQTYTSENNTYSYEKFSAMGCGFTFELETLIFYALSKACCEILDVQGIVSVYGDDIIVPVSIYSMLEHVLQIGGFQLNMEKSFATGAFRESCGGDYYNGYDVRPFYLKDRISYRTLFLLFNFCTRNGLNFVYPKYFAMIRKLLGKDVCQAFKGPDVIGDGHLVDMSLPHCSFKSVELKLDADKLPTHARYDVLKAFALYRQMFPEYDDWTGLYIGCNHLREEPWQRQAPDLKATLVVREDLKSLPA